MKVKVHVFRLGHFARSKIKSESIFLIKHYIITIKKMGRFRPIFNKVKKWISFCIFKSCAEGFGFFSFKLGSNFFCKMACIYLLNSHGGPQSLDFIVTTYRCALLKLPNLPNTSNLKIFPNLKNIKNIPNLLSLQKFSNLLNTSSLSNPKHLKVLTYMSNASLYLATLLNINKRILGMF